MMRDAIPGPDFPPGFRDELQRLRSLIDELAAAAEILEPQSAQIPSLERLVPFIQLIQRLRREGTRIFGRGLFSDPAWDLLLELYLADLTDKTLSISDLCAAAEVPMTTALRTFHILRTKKLLEREQDPTDARRQLVHLTKAGRSKMDELLSSAF